MAISKLQADVREYAACQKITTDYGSQLEKDQKEEIKRRTDEASKKSGNSLVVAYSIVVKYSAKNGIERLIINQFKDSLDRQINNNIIGALKEEEWLLESVGLGTLRTNSLLPTPTQSIKAKDVYEAFLRFDDKPMITGPDAVAKSLQKYCYNGEYCIATGDGTNFTNYFFKRDVPFFEVNSPDYWLIDKSLIPAPTEEKPGTSTGTEEIPKSGNQVNDSGDTTSLA